jgi:hypothetical protein
VRSENGEGGRRRIGFKKNTWRARVGGFETMSNNGWGFVKVEWERKKDLGIK